MDILEIILGINLLVIGVLLTIAIQHAYAYFRPPQPKGKAGQPIAISPETKKRLIENAEHNFEHVLDKTAEDLQHDLSDTASQLSKLLDKLGTDIVEHEVARYRTELDELKKHLESVSGGTEKEFAEQRKALAEKLEADLDNEKQLAVQAIIAEKQQLLQQIDTKLSDAVMAFLVDTLQHNVDLGAQLPYLKSTLEEHKEELKKGVSSDA